VRFIADTLASISRQTYRRWEVIVVEDGSPDGTEQRVRAFARRHRWHRVEYSCNDRNYGAAHTRNIAFEKAGGEFIAFLDADDRWMPEHLAISLKALQDSGKDIAYSTALMIEDQTDHVLGIMGPHAGELADFPQSLFGRGYVTPSATVLRRQVIEDVGPWDTHLRGGDDFCYWLRCIAAGKQFHYIGGCHCLYRKNHHGALTQRLCATLEEQAETKERFINIPGLRPKTCRKYASIAYALAAQYHANCDPRYDPSADPSRIPRLLLKAWRLRPKRVGYLVQGTALGVAELFRRRDRPLPVPTEKPPLRTAA
jgi:glycosyltransferase involved in cell wall biosynthesis